MANWDASEGGGNAFVNDGSFMETFKRLQEQQKDKGSESTTAEEKEERSSSSGGAAEGFTKSSRRTTESETGDQGKVSEKKATERTTVTTDPPLVKASQGVLMGKRKSLMKSIELREKRKRRREELECFSLNAWPPQQEQQIAQEEDDKHKSSAWKAYMAQVKAYEARNCTDSEGHTRPLVK